jgi:hypothetical protein
MQMTHAKIEFGFGVEKDRNQSFLTPDERSVALVKIRSEAAKLFGAYTLTPTTGGWTNPAGVLTEEAGYTLAVIIPVAQFTRSFAQFIAEALNQEAVAVTVTPVNFQIVNHTEITTKL